jgi:hypothetical protein
MTDKEFDWFCKVLKCSTNLSLMLLVVVVILLPFAFFMADEKPWTGLLGFFIFIGWFYLNFKGKSRLMVQERVSRGTWGVTGVMFPLWQNIIFWLLYISMELLMAGGTISIFAKAIWPN